MPQFLQNLQRYANNPLEFVNGVVRVGSMIGNELEYGRKQISGFIEDVVPESMACVRKFTGPHIDGLNENFVKSHSFGPSFIKIYFLVYNLEPDFLCF